MELFGYVSEEHQPPARDMERLKLELTQLDQLFSQRRRQQPQVKVSSRGPIVEGFVFPLKSEQDVERLEAAVNSNVGLREQYVSIGCQCSTRLAHLFYFF